MTYSRKSFSGDAIPTQLANQVEPTDLTITVQALVGYPDTSDGPFIATIDRGTSNEEKVLIQSAMGTILTVAPDGRGADDSTPLQHSVGADFRHTLDRGTINNHETFVAGNGTVTPSVSAVGDVGVNGISPLPAAADHKHARETWSTGLTSASAPGDTALDGTATSPARADHKHARESAATLINDVGPGVWGLPVGGTGLPGATTPTRFVGANVSGAPTGAHPFNQGDFAIDRTGALWICIAGGSPGTWVRAGTPGTVLGQTRVATPGYAYGSPVSTFALVDASTPANTSVNFIAPPSGQVIMRVSTLLNNNNNIAIPNDIRAMFSWSTTAVSGSTLTGDVAHSGCINGSSYRVMDSSVGGLTPGANTTLYLQWSPYNAAGTITINSDALNLYAIQA